MTWWRSCTAASRIFPPALFSIAMAKWPMCISAWSAKPNTSMTFKNFLHSPRLSVLLCLAASLPCFAQNDILTTAAPPKLSVKRGASVSIPLAVRVKQDYHVNTNAPNEEYLIPLRLTWDPKPLTLQTVNFPPGKNEKFDFSQKPVNVYTG